eukprot:1161009-Pelagomonas_calceolata.AAC.5
MSGTLQAMMTFILTALVTCACLSFMYALPCADNEWNPPGHGDIYPSLLGSGMLDKMLGAGIKYLFVSNRCVACSNARAHM